MQTSIEVRYAGVVVAHADEVRKGDASGMGLFLRVTEPMPVGTTVELRAEGADTNARVERILESSEPTAAGMYVRLLDANAAWALAVATSPEEPEPAPVPLMVDLSRAEEIRISNAKAIRQPRPSEAPAPVREQRAESTTSRQADDEAPLLVPSGLAAHAPTVTTDRAPPVVPAAMSGSNNRKTQVYFGTDQVASATGDEARAADAPSTEELPTARTLPPPDGRRRTTKVRKRK